MQTINLETKRKITKKVQSRNVKQILLIDDEKNSILSAAVAGEGYDVVQCDSVRKAWCLVYPHRPHLIIFHLDSSKSSFGGSAGVSRSSGRRSNHSGHFRVCK
jgi:response regulator RpfG family c-di-GMP phosphodiesterase